MVRRGLVVSYYFPPQGGGGVQRWIKFIKYLSQRNWQFSVIAAPPEVSIPLDESLLGELPANLKIYRIPESHQPKSFSHAFYSKLNRTYFLRWLSALIHVTDSRFYWCKIIKPKIEELLDKQKFDILIFTVPPYSLTSLAAEYSTLNKTPVLLDLRDPWTINPYKIYPTPFHRYFDTLREKKVIRSIQLISSAYQSTLQFYQDTIPEFDKKQFVYIPNGFDEADFLGLNEKKSAADDVFRIGFSGSLYSHVNVPKPLLDALKMLRNNGYKIELHHFGTSVYDIKHLAQSMGLQDVYIEHGYLPHKEALQALMGMDATCLILDEAHVHADKTVGGKLYEYLRLKKPIIAIVPEGGEAARTIYQTDSGIVCSKRNPAKIAAEINRLIQKERDFSFLNIAQYERKKLSEQMREFIEENIDIHK